MVKGIFHENTPYINVTLAWGDFVKNHWFVLDTGFTGDLKISNQQAKEMGLTPQSVETFRMANGRKVNIPQALALASMEDCISKVQIGISEGSPLAGINFLKKFEYKAIIDAKHQIVTLKKV